MRSTMILTALLALASTSGQAMPAGDFLTKADALRSRGPFALMSSDYTLLKSSVASAGLELRKERIAAVAAHQRPAYCPPGGKGAMDADELINLIRAMPPAVRAKTELKDAMRVLLIRKYPCPA